MTEFERFRWLKFLWKVFKKVCSGKIRIAILKNFLFDIISVQNSEKQRYFPQTKTPKKSKSDKKTKFSRKKTLGKISKANKVFSRIVVPTYYKDVTSTTWNSPKQNHTHIYSVLNFWYENMYQFLKSFSLSNDWVYVCLLDFVPINWYGKQKYFGFVSMSCEEKILRNLCRKKATNINLSVINVYKFLEHLFSAALCSLSLPF